MHARLSQEAAPAAQFFGSFQLARCDTHSFFGADSLWSPFLVRLQDHQTLDQALIRRYSKPPASTAIDLPSRSMQRKRRSKFKVSTPQRSFQFQLVGGSVGEMQKVVGSHLQHHPQSRRAVHLLQFFAEYL